MKEKQVYIVKTENPAWWYEIYDYNTASLEPGITIACVNEDIGICELLNMSRDTAAEIARVILSILPEKQE